MLSGECTLLVEGEERLLRPWDFFHSPAGTEHIFVGAGDGPCVILMAGARLENEQLHYPVSELAARYGASVKEETSDFEAGVRAVRAVTSGASLVLGPPPLGGMTPALRSGDIPDHRPMRRLSLLESRRAPLTPEVRTSTPNSCAGIVHRERGEGNRQRAHGRRR